MSARDMAKLPCISCEGCGDCCRGMGDTVHLDPYDIAMLCKNLNCTFEDLLDGRIALHAEQGLAIPHLRMEEDRGCCSFLGEDGRCGIHSFRPGFCRLFPLGRQYDGKGFQYFIVPGGCDMPGKTKIRIRKWLDIPDLPRYESFVSRWHYLSGTPRPGLPAHRTRNSIKRSICFCCRPFTASPMILTGISMTSSRNVSQRLPGCSLTEKRSLPDLPALYRKQIREGFCHFLISAPESFISFSIVRKDVRFRRQLF